MRHDEVIEQLRGLNPVPERPVADEAAHAAREQVWRALSFAQEVGRPSAPAGSPRSVRRLALSVALTVLVVGAAIGGGVAGVQQLRDTGPPLPPEFEVDRAGAVFIGSEDGISFFRTTGASEGSRCLVQTLPGTDVSGATICAPGDQYAEAGGLASVNALSPGYLVAALLPEGITQATVSGQTVPVTDRSLLVRVGSAPGVAIRVHGPGAAQARSALGGPAAASYRAEGPLGPSYEVLLTPTG